MTLEEAQELVQRYASFSFIGKWLMSRKYKKALELIARGIAIINLNK